MDWIEQLTGLDPDHGNGSLELTIFLAVLAVVLIVGLSVWSRRYVGRRHTRPTGL